jgi:hypothetical protein
MATFINNHSSFPRPAYLGRHRPSSHLFVHLASKTCYSIFHFDIICVDETALQSLLLPALSSFACHAFPRKFSALH